MTRFALSKTIKMIDFAEPGGSDDREEGEIVDDFEAISDYSIQSPSYSGKSVSPRGLLQDVSLSSISDIGDDDLYSAHYIFSEGKNRYKRKKPPRHSVNRRSKRRKKSVEYYARPSHVYRKTQHRHDKGSSTESDDDGKLDYRTLRQLKEAIRIDTSHAIEQKSLRTRLQAMIQLDSAQSQEEEVEALRTLALLSNSKIDEEATINNLKSNDTLINKEDVIEIIEENENKANVKDEKLENLDDEELIELRLAALKSAIIKKATERKKRKEKLNVDIVEVNTENKENLSLKNDNDVIVISDGGANENNCDCSSKETEIAIAPDEIKAAASSAINTDDVALDTNILKSNNVVIEEDVDIMRAMLLASISTRITSNAVHNSSKPISKKVPVKDVGKRKTVLPVLQPKPFKNTNMPTVKPLIININNDSDSDSDTIDKKSKITTTNKADDLADTVTLFLKKQRAAVEAKSKMQNEVPSLDKSVVKLLPKSQQREYQFLKQKLFMARRKRLRKASSKTNIAMKIQDIATKPPVNRSRQEINLNGLQKTLEDMQIQNNGRLQMKGKYKELTPLLRRVNQASVDRKQCEMEIKKLLEDLKKTRSKLTAAHQQFMTLVKCLTNEKEAIDQRPNKEVNIENTAVVNSVTCTSTPIRPDTHETIGDNTAVRDLSSICHSTKIDEEVEKVEENEMLMDNETNNELLSKRYVSPLDIKNRGDAVNDPLTTFCPYELFGVCRDPECTFNHYSKT